MKFKCSQKIIVTYVSDECLVLDTSNFLCFIVNKTAGWLLSICSDFISLEDAVNLATKRYSIKKSSNIAQDIKEIVIAFNKKGIIEIG